MRWYYLGQALHPLGVDVEIVSSSSFHKYSSPPAIGAPYETQDVNGLTYHWLKTRPYRNRGVAQVINQIEFIARCYAFATHLAKYRPDVVIASSPHPLVNFPARAIAKKSGANFVFEVRDLWPEVLLELGSFRRSHPYILALKAAERYGVKYADRVISVKPGDGDYFASEYELPSQRFSYVPNGFLPEDSDSPAPQVIQRLRGSYYFLIGYVGALSTYYNLDHLLELARRFRDRSDVGFVVVGKGERFETLQRRASEMSLEHFYLLGSIPKSEVPNTLTYFDAGYVGLADVGVHRYGISCNKIYEYMYAGKPIIGSYRAGYDPVAAAGCGFVAPPGDYDPLVRGIERLIDEPGLSADMGKKARSYFDSHHDFRVVARRLKEMFLTEGNGLAGRDVE
jgi:glycosyltransferase involved in cell wall biosynthesis